MFRFFKRNKIERWELDLLLKVLSKLPSEYSILSQQINDGILRGVLTGISDIPGCVVFTYNSDILKRYDKPNAPDFKLSSIRVYDKKSSKFLSYEIYVSSGTVNGYSLEGEQKKDIDLDKIDIVNFKKIPIGLSDYQRIAHLLSDRDKKLITPTDVYTVHINNKEYFHIRDLEDGDFIGMDEKKTFFRITHDPMEITVLPQDLFEILL